MKGSRSSIRYAKAYMKLAIEQSFVDKAIEDINLILQTVKANHELRLFLHSPLIKADKKQGAFNSIFNGKTQEQTARFISEIIKQGREKQLTEICERFIDLYNESHNIARISVTTATPMDDKMRAKLLDVVKNKYHYSKLELNEVIDENIIGGMIMRIGDKQLDSSIRRQINDLKKELLQE